MMLFAGFKSRHAWWGGVCACLVLAGAMGVHLCVPRAASAQSPQAETVQAEPMVLGVVDYETLIKAHSDYPKLEQLDEQIQVLQQELEFLPLTDQRRAVDSSRKKMEAEVEKARKELEAERDRITKELNGLSQALTVQLESEGKKLQKHYQGVFNERMKKLAPAQPQLSKAMRESMSSYVADLSAVREQRVVAKRLELERAVQVELDAERSRVDSEIAAYDNELMAQNQEKLLNLHLQLQTVTDPEEEAKIQQQLSDLSDEENKMKEARHKELMAEFEKLATEKRNGVEKELKAYERSISAEAEKKAYAQQGKIVGSVAQVNPASMQAEAQAEVDKIKAAIDAEMQAKQAEMRSLMEAKSEEARKKLEKKQLDVQKRLELLQKQLSQMVEASRKDVSAETRQKMDEAEANIKDLQKQREDLLETMKSQLSVVVGQVAEKHQVPSVVGSYVINVDCVDLTDYAVVAAKQAVH